MLDKSKHHFILSNILKDIYSDYKLASVLGFKGGTALYFFYDLPRFSTDLDFDLIDLETKEQVISSIENIMRQYGELKESKLMNNSYLAVLLYQEQAQNIKIEISFRNFGSQYESKNFFGIPVLTMRIEDMFANKIVALQERMGKSNRDLFDTWFLLTKNFEINEAIVKTRTGICLKEHICGLLKALESYDAKHINSGIGELLDPEMKAWVKENLLKELAFQLSVKV